MQAELNDIAINMLPTVKAHISHAAQFERDQMINYALRQINNSGVALDDMDSEQIIRFEGELIKTFTYKGWLQAQ